MIDVVAGGQGNFASFMVFPPSEERICETFGRMCCWSESKQYWVQLKDGVVALGLGSDLGENTVLVHKLPAGSAEETDGSQGQGNASWGGGGSTNASQDATTAAAPPFPARHVTFTCFNTPVFYQV